MFPTWLPLAIGFGASLPHFGCFLDHREQWTMPYVPSLTSGECVQFGGIKTLAIAEMSNVHKTVIDEKNPDARWI